jgi:hypothetical protein
MYATRFVGGFIKHAEYDSNYSTRAVHYIAEIKAAVTTENPDSSFSRKRRQADRQDWEPNDAVGEDSTFNMATRKFLTELETPMSYKPSVQGRAIKSDCEWLGADPKTLTEHLHEIGFGDVMITLTPSDAASVACR